MSRFLDPRYATLEPYTPGEQPRDQVFIKLNTNESPYPPSPEVLSILNDEENRKLRLYSDPTAKAVVDAIADFYGLDSSNVVVSNGSDEILAFSFLAFCGKKGVAFPAISYGFYPVFADLFGVKARAIPLREDLTIDINDYLVPGENVVIANPNAPTGLELSRADIIKLLEAHPDDIVLLDEAYVDFGGQSSVDLLGKYENLLIVQTFSKSRSLAGARIGFALGSPEVIADLNAIRFSFNPYNLNRLSILAGAAAMRDRAYFEACTTKIIATRARTADALKALGCTVTDSRANFLFVRLPGIGGGDVLRMLRTKGILVRWFDKDPIRDYLRITIGSDSEMDALIEAVTEILKEVHA